MLLLETSFCYPFVRPVFVAHGLSNRDENNDVGLQGKQILLSGFGEIKCVFQSATFFIHKIPLFGSSFLVNQLWKHSIIIIITFDFCSAINFLSFNDYPSFTLFVLKQVTPPRTGWGGVQ